MKKEIIKQQDYSYMFYVPSVLRSKFPIDSSAFPIIYFLWHKNMHSRERFTRVSLPRLQELRFRSPHEGIEKSLDRIYQRNQIELGWPTDAQHLFEGIARKNTVAVIGAALGDEGKGRIVDNKIQCLLNMPDVKIVDVIRFNGGNNAGHTIEKDGVKLALHVVPSGVMYEETVGIMDRGEIIHPEDLQTEVIYAENKVGDLRGKLILSEEAILCTDLERAEETLNGIKRGEARGGTGRGISPAYAHHYDRQGLEIQHLMKDNWREILSEQYDMYGKMLGAFDMNSSETEIPDYKATLKEGKEIKRKVGNKEEFLDRLETAREWILDRNMVSNTFQIHKEIFSDMKHGVLFESAQAGGLDAWLGTRPDVTSSNTRASGIEEGTAFWRPQDIQDRIGVFKITYTSSVGARDMPTDTHLSKKTNDLPENATSDQIRAAWIRDEANEKGTTTGRWRDIDNLDLALINYNIRMSGIEMLAGTHLDIARKDENIKVCTHYTDSKSNFVPYQPGLKYQEGAVPHYVELPSWDGQSCRRAKSINDLPENAVKFLAFIQARTGVPIVAVTTGPARENFIPFNGYNR